MLGTNAAVERAPAVLRDVPMRVVDAGDTVIACSYGHHDHAAYEQEARSRSATVAAAFEIAVVHTHGRISDDAGSLGALLAGVPDDDVTPDTFPLTLLLGSPRAHENPSQQAPLQEAHPPAPWWTPPTAVRMEYPLAEWVETVYVPGRRRAGERRGGALIGWDMRLTPSWRLGLDPASGGALTCVLSGSLLWMVDREASRRWSGRRLSAIPFASPSRYCRVEEAVDTTVAATLVVDMWNDTLGALRISCGSDAGTSARMSHG